MPTVEELENLSTEELHDRAFRIARRRLDVGFFWNLLKAIPAAEAAAGHMDEAQQDAMSLSARVDDLLHPDSPEEAEALRPIYISYLSENDEGESS